MTIQVELEHRLRLESVCLLCVVLGVYSGFVYTRQALFQNYTTLSPCEFLIVNFDDWIDSALTLEDSTQHILSGSYSLPNKLII